MSERWEDPKNVAAAIEKVAPLPDEREPTSEDALLLYLQGKPLANGEWPHLLWCSGDRRKPPGSRGVSCCCKPPVPEEREPVAWVSLDSLEMAVETVTAWKYEPGGPDGYFIPLYRGVTDE